MRPVPQHSGGANTEGSGKTIQGRPVEKSNLAHFTFYCNTTLSCKVLRWTVAHMQSAHSWWDAMWRQLCILLFPRNHRDKKKKIVVAVKNCKKSSDMPLCALICSSSWTFWINMISQCCLKQQREPRAVFSLNHHLVLFCFLQEKTIYCDVVFGFATTLLDGKNSILLETLHDFESLPKRVAKLIKLVVKKTLKLGFIDANSIFWWNALDAK